MALTSFRGTKSAAAAAAPARRRHVLVVKAAAAPSKQQQQQQQQPLLRTIGAGLCTAGLAASLCLSPACAQAAGAQQLADLLREEFGFVDSNKDGVVTKSELQQLMKNISKEANVPLVDGEQLDFSMRLFDLNQDGRLTTEELLRSLVLDGAVDEEAVDEDVFGVFDSNNNGTIECSEFRAALGDLGANGDAAKDFVFGRVDSLSNSQGSLNSSAFGNALVLMRTVLLGY